MFEQHPVPQQISSYQFRLVGDMTLKQFFQLAAGCVIALIIYGTPLPGIFKWPLIVLFVVGGAAFAFLPLQDRPLAVWLLAFFKSIYGPTIYFWEKDKSPVYFLADDKANPAATAGIPTNTQQAQNPSVATPSDNAVANLEKSEHSFLSKITDIVGIGHKSQTTSTQQASTIATQSPLTADTTPAAPLAPISINSSAISAQAIIDRHSSAELSSPTGKPISQPGNENKISIPAIGAVKVEPKVTTENTLTQNETGANEKITTDTISTVSSSQPQKTKTATFSGAAKPPSAPEYPNLIVGQVFDSTGKIVEGAIMEIKDSGGRAVRAFRSNQLGHFMTATPLPDGKYTLQAEKDGLEFTAVDITMNGGLIEPIAVWAEPTTKQQ